MDKIVHFEIPTKDPARASAFYSKAFGWQITQIPNFDYWGVMTTESDKDGRPTSPGAINGGMGKVNDVLKVPTVTVSVADIDNALANIEKLGGKVAEKKTAVGNMGFTAYFTDTEGNVIGLWQNASG